MYKALVVGGASGIGLSVSLELSKICENVTIIDRKIPDIQLPKNVNCTIVNLIYTDYLWIEKIKDIDCLFISAGFGRVDFFENLHEKEIYNLFQVNSVSTFLILNKFISKIKSSKPFYCGVMVSIAGRIASPLFSIYSATKAALFRGIEAINMELKMSGTRNRILEISPGSLPGTSFAGGKTDIEKNLSIARSIINAMLRQDTLFIPQYNEIFKKVIERYKSDSEKFAEESFHFKIDNNRLQPIKQISIGYLSGTFDLFHVGHLNLIKRAKEHCDYLVVGVHKDASHKGKNVFIPFEERKEILKSLKYVDKVIESEKEDSDIYSKGIIKYDKLFVGSDYKGTERFNRYEEYFADKGVEIIYFPYTQTTSSTQLREVILSQSNIRNDIEG